MFFGTVTVGWFKVTGQNWLTGQTCKWSRSDFGRLWLSRCRDAGPRQPWVWDGKSPEPGARLSDLTRTALEDFLPPFEARFRADRDPARWVPVVQEILHSPLVDDELKIGLLLSENGQRLWEQTATSLPLSLHPKMSAALHLHERWLNLDRDLTFSDRKMAEVLTEADVLAGWDDERRRGFQARREAAERLRQEEAAFRLALGQGRRQDDRGQLVLTEEFKQAFRALKNYQPLLFVTGRPGTGKSTFIRALKTELSGRNLAVCAFTGAAALNVGGQTLHSFFQLPPQVLTPGSLRPAGYKLSAKLNALEILVIDEVSLLRPDLADALDERLRTCRRSSQPFGGVQVVLVGDLYQLPPVGGRDDEAEARWLAATYPRGRWFHAARVFDRLSPVLVELTQVFRQTQAEFLHVLGAVREGHLSSADLAAFNQKILALPPFAPDEFHTLLVPHNKDVTLHNQSRLSRLPGTARSYRALVDGEPEKDGDSKYPADKELVLKPKAQVMFLKNDPAGRWVNGDFGIVEDLGDEALTVTSASGTHRVERAVWDLSKYDLDTHGRLVPQKTGTFRQFPLRLSWAVTIHKMQGQTVERMHLDLGTGAFEPGMTYVALSRCRTWQGLRFSRPLVPADLTIDPTVGPWLDGLKRV